MSDEGGDTVDHSGDGGNALRVAPLSSLLLSQWILRAQTHQRSLSLAQVHIVAIATLILHAITKRGLCLNLSRLNSSVLLPLGTAEREPQNVLFSPELWLQLRPSLGITRLYNTYCALPSNMNPPMQVSGSSSLGYRLIDN